MPFLSRESYAYITFFYWTQKMVKTFATFYLCVLFIRMNRLNILLLLLAIIFSCKTKKEISLPEENPVFTEVFPGIWKATPGEPEDFNLLSVSGKPPVANMLKKKGSTDFPFSSDEITAQVKNHKTFLRFPLKKEEQIYGFGLNFKTVQLRGQILRLHVDHYGGRDDGRTHAPVPFFVSSEGYGVLINSARYIDVYAGTGVRTDSAEPAQARDRNTDKKWTSRPYSDNLEMVVPGDGVEILVFAGENMLDVVQRFNLYCGGGVLPPKWGLGFWHRTPTLYTDRDVEKEISDFKRNDFPLDVIGLEPGWHSKSYPCTFEWDSVRFPAPGNFVGQTADEGVKINLWMNPYISPDASLYNKLLPFAGTHTVWNGIVPDYTLKNARNIMQEHFQEHILGLGVSGFKMDEIDGYDRWLWPDVAQFPSGHDAEQMRQTYGLQMMTLTDEAFRKNNQRSYGLIRAANAGSVSFPYVIYNDYYNHQDFITALINSGFSGLLWTPEVRASKTGEEWLRRMQTSCFSPMAMINAWADGTKPWSFPEVYEQCREVAFLRMQLLPYLYSIFADYHFNGTPPFRAMNLEEGFGPQTVETRKKLDATENPYEEAVRKEVRDQYMMGPSLLVAPLFSGDKGRSVILPDGNWYDFYTGKFAGNGEIIAIPENFEKIPLFVKDGGIIPMIPAIRQTREWSGQISLEIRVYGEKPGEFILYDDDGSTFNYEKGEYTTRLLKTNGETGSMENIHDSDHWSYGDVHWNFLKE